MANIAIKLKTDKNETIMMKTLTTITLIKSTITCFKKRAKSNKNNRDQKMIEMKW